MLSNNTNIHIATSVIYSCPHYDAGLIIELIDNRLSINRFGLYMRWLNYHHLYYFLTVCQKGSVTAASRHLRLSQPTVSAQLRSLEDVLGHKLFEKQGRSLVLTETGRCVRDYAEQIFALGSELFRVIEGAIIPTRQLLKIGITDMMPKHVVYRLIDPLFATHPSLRIVFYEDTSERLLSMLSIQEIDLVIADTPIPPQVKIKAFNHLLGESAISVLATRKLAKKYKKHFPHSMDNAPILLPVTLAVVRRELDTFFQSLSIQPSIVGEFQDSALMKIFAKSGRGLLPVPSIVEKEVCTEYSLSVVGRITEVKERFYLLSPERRLHHPAVSQLHDRAQRGLFIKPTKS